jgi:hypothetical protein
MESTFFSIEVEGILNFCYSTYLKQKLQATKVTDTLGLVNNR